MSPAHKAWCTTEHERAVKDAFIFDLSCDLMRETTVDSREVRSTIILESCLTDCSRFIEALVTLESVVALINEELGYQCRYELLVDGKPAHFAMQKAVERLSAREVQP